MSEIDPADLALALGEIPLFRELQRLIASQAGPVNWEIAGQIARAVAGAGKPGPAAGPSERELFEADCRAAELRVAQLTGLEPTTASETMVVDRVQWADLNLSSFAPLIDRLAVRIGGQMQTPAPAGIMNALGPFLLGVQVGFLAGYLSRRVLGQYDLCYPAQQQGRLYFVYPNIVEVEQELQVDPKQFRMWIAIHEVTHQLQFQSVPWTREYFTGLVNRYIDGAEIDAGEVVERLRGLSDPENLEKLLQNPDQLLPMLMTSEQQTVVDEIQAFMSVLEGYAEWTMNVVGKELLSEFDKMREGVARRRVERSSAERMLEQLLGLDLKREQYRAGEKFIQQIAEADRLKLLWEGPQNIPTLQELHDPPKWLSRVAFS